MKSRTINEYILSEEDILSLIGEVGVIEEGVWRNSNSTLRIRIIKGDNK